MSDEISKKNKRVALIILGIVFGMLTLTAFSVQLYELYCRVTGFGGKAVQSSSSATTILDRAMKVRFNTDVNPSLPWEFSSDQPPVTLKIGQEMAVSFTATNIGDKAIAGTAIYNIDPPAAGKYFHKTQCFCFNYQLIASGDTAHFPVIFYIDPELDNDPQLRDLKTITLSYSFFEADSKELDNALEDFYNQGKSGTTSIEMK